MAVTGLGFVYIMLCPSFRESFIITCISLEKKIMIFGSGKEN